MAKFLKIGTTGFPTEESTVATSAGAGDSGKVPGLDSSGKLDSTFMPAGLGSDSITLNAGESLSAGNLVYIAAAGTVFKADANAVAKAAIGFVLASSTIGNPATVLMEGSLSGLSTLTIGSPYFLSDSATGGVTLTAPSGAGKIVQVIGWATTATTISFEAGEPTVRV